MWKQKALFVGSLTLLLGMAPAEEQRGATEKTFVNSGNAESVENEGLFRAHPPTLKINTPTKITYIETYHWNHKKGKAPGFIGLKHKDGTLYKWEASGRAGQVNVPNAYWFAKPNEVIKPGTYTVYDSDNSTWSHNEKSGHVGFAIVKGIPEPAKKK